MGSAHQQPGKWLGCAGWGVVVLAAGGLGGESGAKLVGELVGAVAGDLQPGAAFGSLGGERGEDEVPTRGDVGRGQLAVAGAVVRVGQEVEYRSVVPQREASCRCPLQQVGHFPVHPQGAVSKAALGEVRCSSSSPGLVRHWAIRPASS